MNQDEKDRLSRKLGLLAQYYKPDSYSQAQLLLNSGADVNYKYNDASILFYSIYDCAGYGSGDDLGCERIPLLLIEKGANVNNDDKKLLYISIINKHVKVPIELYNSGYVLKSGELNNILQYTKHRELNEDIKALIKALIKKYKDKKVTNLKSRIQPVLEPKMYDRAYIMLGHGIEFDYDSQPKIVPPGCMLVVQAQSGEVNYLHLNFEQELLTLGDKLLDPITNYHEILTKTSYYTKRSAWVPSIAEGLSFKQKSLAIYREGDEYPDYGYELISKWGLDASNKHTKDKNPARYILTNSGIIEYPFTGNPVEHIDTIIDSNTEGRDIFRNIFNGSIYPNMDEIDTIIDIMPTKTIHGILVNYRIKNKMKIRQSEIFEKIKEGIFKPGVYYNFVCRSTDVNRITKMNRTKQSEREQNNNNRNAFFQKLNHERYNNLGVGRMPLEFKRAIGEAEVHRKPYIVHTYGNLSAEMPQEAQVASLNTVSVPNNTNATGTPPNNALSVAHVNNATAPTAPTASTASTSPTLSPINSRMRANQLKAEAATEVNRRFKLKNPGEVVRATRPRTSSSGGRYTRRRSLSKKSRKSRRKRHA